MADRSYNFDGGTLPSVFKKLRTDTELVTDRSLSGSYSVYFGGGDNSPFFQWIEPEMEEPGGVSLESIQVHLQETSNSSGTGFKVYNENGEVLAGMATENPGWVVFQGGGNGNTTSLNGGSQYDVWLRFKMSFDWANEQVTYEFEDLGNGNTASLTQPFEHPGSGITMAALDDNNFGAGTSDTWLDDVQLTFAPAFTIEGTITEDGTAVAAPVYLLDADFNKLAGKNSATDGTYSFRRAYRGLQYYVLTAVSGRRPLVHGPFDEPAQS